METMMKLGPEEMNGSIWDDRGKSTIDQILISYGKYAVNSLQFVYIVDGKLVPSEVHGTGTGLNFDILTFDHPREYLTSVTGKYAEYASDRLVSITFGTNKGKYGPFGMDPGKNHLGIIYRPFAYNFGPKSSFGGFHGSDYNSCLYAIGIYVRAPGSVTETEKNIARIKIEDDQS